MRWRLVWDNWLYGLRPLWSRLFSVRASAKGTMRRDASLNLRCHFLLSRLSWQASANDFHSLHHLLWREVCQRGKRKLHGVHGKAVFCALR